MKTEAFEPDRQFGIPRRPRFLRELVVVPLENQLVVDGVEQLQVLRGEATLTFLPNLISLMDGRRTLQHLEDALPTVSVEHVRAAISMLASGGMVEDGAADRQLGPAPNLETLAFLRRLGGATRAHRSGREAYDNVQGSQVLIVDSTAGSAHGGVLKALLENTGLPRVTLLDRTSWHGWPAAFRGSPEKLLVSLCFGEEDSEWHAELDDWCFERRLSWLRVVVNYNDGYVDLGPFFHPDENPCYRCCRDVHGRLPGGPGSSPAEAHLADDHFWTSVAATEIAYLLSRIGPLASRRSFRRYDLRRGDSKHLRCPRAPGCLRCRPLREATAAPKLVRRDRRLLMDTALVFEDYVGLQSRAVLEVQAEHGHASVSRVPLARQAKRPSICKHQTLPGGTPDLSPGILHILGGDAAISTEPLTVDELAALLKMSVGIRDPGTGHNKLQRWAATAGNLGSVELFVAARRVSGLAPGLYFYQPHEHSLACLDRHSGALDIDDFMRRSLLASSGGLPDVLVLFTGAYHRAARKYGPFAYRLINLDAGAAVSQLHIVAASLGIRSRTVTRWADDLIEHQLNLEPFVEQSTAVVELFRSASALPPQPPSSPGRVVLRTGTPPSGKTARDFWELRVSEIAELLYRESRVKECELLDSPFAIPAEFIGVPYSGSSSVTIPRPSGGGRPVGRILAHRTTVRNYTDAPVTLDQLGTMLHYAQHGDAGDWPEEQREGNLLSFQVLAWRVQGLPPGVYAYDPPSHALHLTAPAPSPENAIELLVQSEYAAAPVLVWIAANLAAACARHGAFGHRQLLLRAGSAGHRLWMAALGMGLSGSLIAGLVPGAARKQLGFDGYHLAGLFGVTTGYRARTGESSRPLSPPI